MLLDPCTIPVKHMRVFFILTICLGFIKWVMDVHQKMSEAITFSLYTQNPLQYPLYSQGANIQQYKVTAVKNIRSGDHEFSFEIAL